MENKFIRNGIEVLIREAEKKDAKEIIDFYNIVGGETDFLSFGANEFKATVEAEENRIENSKNEQNSIMVLALLDNKIISIATIDSVAKNRLKHVGELGIVVKKEYCNMGLGTYLMNYLIEWSKSNGITQKIALVTRADNSRAIEVYKRVGFETEGVLRKDNCEKGIYYDTLYMGLLFI